MPDDYRRFLAELKRRNVFRVAAVYGATGFVVLQVAELLVEGLVLPPLALTLAIFLVLLGFPVALVLAWALDLTPEGIRRTDAATEGEIDAILALPARVRWPSGLLALAGIAVLMGGAWWAGRATADPATGPTPPAGATEGAGLDAASVVRTAYADLSADARPSIAVLPFADMSPEGDQEYFADGMTEELLNTLARIRGLRVGARTSSFAYKGRDLDLRDVGDELGVRYVVEGSVRKHEDRLRITAQLIDAESNFHLWSDTYDRTLDDVFAVQSEIAEAIAGELEVSLGLGGAERLVSPTSDMAAYEAYLAGQARLRERGAGVEEAVLLFGSVTERDPEWAPGWAGLALALSVAPYHEEVDPTSPPLPTDSAWAVATERAEAAARRALALEPGLPAAEVALGNVFRERRDWAESERHYLQALATDRDDVEAHQQFGEMLAATGRLDEAVRSARRAVELDPTAVIRLNALGYLLGYQGRTEEAIDVLRRAVAAGPTFVSPYTNLADLYVQLGQWDRAEEIMARAVRSLPVGGPENDPAALDARVRDAIRSLRAGDLEEPAAWNRAWAISTWIGQGRTDRALDALVVESERWGSYGSDYLSYLWAPQWDGLRDDRRFRRVLERGGLAGQTLRVAGRAAGS